MVLISDFQVWTTTLQESLQLYITEIYNNSLDSRSHCPPGGCTSAPNQSAAIRKLWMQTGWLGSSTGKLGHGHSVKRNAEGYCPHKSIRIQQPCPGRAVNHTRPKLWHNKMMLTRIGLPAKLPCQVYNLWLVPCSFLLSRKMFSNIFCLSSSRAQSLIWVPVMTFVSLNKNWQTTTEPKFKIYSGLQARGQWYLSRPVN